MSDLITGDLPLQPEVLSTETFLEGYSPAEIARLDHVIIDGMLTLIFNIGPETDTVGIEDELCTAAYQLDPDELAPLSVHAMLKIASEESLLTQAMTAFVHQRVAREDMRLLQTDWRSYIEVLRGLFEGYVATELLDGGMHEESYEQNRLQYMIYPAERRLLLLEDAG
jgi:hypothetical protein